MPDPVSRIRYLLLSSSAGLRGAFLGNLFGTYEQSAGSQGERVLFPVEEGVLEVVGVGGPAQARQVVEKVLGAGLGLDGILLLLPAGSETALAEARDLKEWLKGRRERIAVRAWMVEETPPPDKEAAKRMLLALVAEQERLLGGSR